MTLTGRLGNSLNLGDSETRSLKDAGIPNGAQVGAAALYLAPGYRVLAPSTRCNDAAATGHVLTDIADNRFSWSSK